MELHLIERAIKSQIVTTNNHADRLETDPEYSLGIKELGNMVFASIAFMYGYSTDEISDYLGIGKRSAKEQLKVSQDCMIEFLAREDRMHDDFCRMLYMKIRLSINCIRNHYMTRSKINLSEIKY